MEKRIRKFILKKNENIDKFRISLWKNVSGSKKVEYAWEMVVEAMQIKGKNNSLKFRKIIRINR